MTLAHPSLNAPGAAQMRGWRRDHTLQPTALVNEAFFRVVKAGQIEWRDRNHFLAICARFMRRVLVDSARSHYYQRRGGGAIKMTADSLELAAPMDFEGILAVHLALEELQKQRDPRKAEVVELRSFGGTHSGRSGRWTGYLRRVRPPRLALGDGMAP